MGCVAIILQIIILQTIFTPPFFTRELLFAFIRAIRAKNGKKNLTTEVLARAFARNQNWLITKYKNLRNFFGRIIYLAE